MRVVFLGDSLSAGYRLSPEEAFPARLVAKVRDAGLPFEIVNAGVSGDTTAGGLARFEWTLAKGADVLVLELGANDGLRGLDVDAARKNLETILTKAVDRGLAILLLGMRVPPNYGARYSERFAAIFPALAKQFAIPCVPFLLEAVASNPKLNLGDGIHPNAAGHAVVAETVWKALEPVLRERARRKPGRS